MVFEIEWYEHAVQKISNVELKQCSQTNLACAVFEQRAADNDTTFEK